MAETTEKIKVTFGYGSILQAAADDYPGGVNFGYDETTNAGAIYRMGKLVSSRVLDILVNDSETEGVHNIVVKYVDTDGVVREHTFDAVSEELINAINSNKGEVYNEGDYIVIDASNNISINYTALYGKVKDDLASAGIGDSSAINEQQSARILGIENSYADSVTLSEESEGADTQTVTVNVKSRNTESENFDDTAIEFEIPTSDYYKRIDSSLNALADRSEDVEQSERISAIENSYADSVTLSEESEGADTQTVTVNVKSRNTESETVNNSVEFKVPTDEYYSRIDSSLNELASKLDVSTGSEGVEWLDIDALLSETTN